MALRSGLQILRDGGPQRSHFSLLRCICDKNPVFRGKFRDEKVIIEFWRTRNRAAGRTRLAALLGTSLSTGLATGLTTLHGAAAQPASTEHVTVTDQRFRPEEVS